MANRLVRPQFGAENRHDFPGATGPVARLAAFTTDLADNRKLVHHMGSIYQHRDRTGEAVWPQLDLTFHLR
jgi:hypothetical protein